MYKEFTRGKYNGLIVASIAFLVYVNSLGNGFTLDDDSVILHNPILRGDVISLFSSIDTTGESQLLPFYRPLTYLSYMAEWHLHGFNPFYVRLFNVFLHSVNAFLVFCLARSFSKNSIYFPLLAGLLFAVHPLHSEGVNFNAGGRNTMLACLFSLAAYLIHSKAIRNQKRLYAYAGAFLLLAGLFSKESALMILPCIGVLELSMLNENHRGNRLQSVMRLAPYLAVTIIYLVLRWQTLSKLGIQTSIIPGVGTSLLESMYLTSDLGTRLLNNFYIIPRYLLIVIWPMALAPRYMIPDDLNLFLLPLLGGWLAILCSLGWVITKGRSPASIFGLMWMVLFWLPVSGIVIVPGSPLADRFLYIPAIGLWIIISDQMARFFTTDKSALHRAKLMVTVVILFLLATLTINRNQDWKSNYTLFSRFASQYPENVHARAGLGKIFYGKGKEQNLYLAEQEFEQVLALDPNFPMIYTYLGNIKLNRGYLEEALLSYSRALEVYPYDKEARVNRGITLEKLNRPKEALTDYIFFLTSPGSPLKIPGAMEHVEKRVKELAQ